MAFGIVPEHSHGEPLRIDSEHGQRGTGFFRNLLDYRLAAQIDNDPASHRALENLIDFRAQLVQ
jgi:hypothetical protein